LLTIWDWQQEFCHCGIVIKRRRRRKYCFVHVLHSYARLPPHRNDLTGSSSLQRIKQHISCGWGEGSRSASLSCGKNA
jgi:hypothetical protein